MRGDRELLEMVAIILTVGIVMAGIVLIGWLTVGSCGG